MRDIPNHLFAFRLSAISLLVAVLLCLSAAGGPYCNAAESPKTLSKQIQTAEEMRIEAAEWAKALRQSYAQKQMRGKRRVVSEENYIQALSLYTDAEKAVNGWLARLQWELEHKRDIEQSSEYDESIKRAADNAEQFIGYAKGVLLDRKMGGPLSVGDLLKVLTDFGLQIWKEYRSGEQKQREALVKRLHTLKWKHFDGT